MMYSSRSIIPRALIIWLGISAASIGVQLLFKPRVKRFVPAIHELPGFLDAAKALGSLELHWVFVRALGVSAVLAQTLHTACATVWRAPMLRVRTSIGRTDSDLDSKSYYLAEAESVRALVRATGGGQQHLFLLDEIFRGTNTTERVAAASAVLSYLNRGTDLVFVATHDIEVLELLGSGFDAYHFREQVDDDVLTFDYRIHLDPSSTRNAITLLRLMEYPEELIAEALAAVDWASR